jgi:dienelactone hydrolase
MKRQSELTKMKIGLMALFLSALSGCASTYDQFKVHTDKPGATSGFVSSKPFQLMSVKNAAVQPGAESITIYIEGDGRAWLNKSTPSADPSPRNYLVVDLAMADAKPAIYLARPCQYQLMFDTKACNNSMWTSQRFSRAVIDSYSHALDELKRDYQNRGFKLVGYSGGGAVAMALAGERSDISDVVTLAGNIDPNAWIMLHRLSPLGNVVDPASYADTLAKIPQRHFVGRSDTVVPASLVQGFIQKTGAACADVVDIQATHEKGWNAVSQRMIYQPVLCSATGQR